MRDTLAMTTPPTMLRRILALVLTVALPVAVTAACSSSDDGAGDGAGDEGASSTTVASEDGDEGADTTEFCDRVEVFDDLDTDDTISTEVVDEFDDLAAMAPEEVEEELAVMAELFRTISETDVDDEEAFAEIMALFLDPELIAASEAVEAYVLDECGIDIDPDDSDDDLDGSEGDDTDATDDTDDGAAGDALGLDAFDAFLDEVGGADSWRDDVVGTSISSTGDNADVTIDFPAGIDSGTALDARDAAAEYFGSVVGDLSVTVTVDGSDAATYDPSTGCAPVS